MGTIRQFRLDGPDDTIMDYYRVQCTMHNARTVKWDRMRKTKAGSVSLGGRNTVREDGKVNAWRFRHHPGSAVSPAWRAGRSYMWLPGT